MSAVSDCVESPLIPYNHAGKWGFCNAEREIVIRCQYDQTDFFQNDLAIVRNGVAYTDWHFGMINTCGEVAIPLEYANLEPFSDGLAKMRAFGKMLYGFLDTSGDTKIYPAFTTAYPFREGLAYVQCVEHRRQQEHGFINTDGKMQIRGTFLFDDADYFHEGFAVVQHDAARGTFYSYLQKSGQFLRGTSEYDISWLSHAAPFTNGVAGIWGELTGFRLINTRGETLFDAGFMYDNCSGEIHDSLLRVKKGENWGFIDTTGKEIIPCMIDFYRIEHFYDGLARFQYEEHGTFGYADKKPNTVIPPEFKAADNFSEGLACVCRADLYGFINTKGEEVIPCRYDYASSFGNYEVGFALVRRGALKCYIDHNGMEYGAV